MLARRSLLALCAAFSAWTWAIANCLAGGAADLPANRWVRLTADGSAGYTFSRPIYVPSRKQVLHWGGVAIGDPRPWYRNDVRAFDPATLRWVSDYASAKKLPGLLHPYGKGSYFKGHGEMLSCGTPAPSMIVDAVCYDSKRKQLIYTTPGLMAAYDPHTRTWRDLKARTLLAGKTLPGGPPVYGAGTCYDPTHDEIVMFPHWGGFHTDLRHVTGTVSGHYGTLIYRFADNTWRRAAEQFLPPGTDRVRERLLTLMSRLSFVLDATWASRAGLDARQQKELHSYWAALAQEVEQATDGMPGTIRGRFAAAALGVRSAADCLAKGKLADVRLAVLAPGSAALGAMEAMVTRDLAYQPQARCGTPLVYDAKHQVMVLFGGHDGLVRTDLAAGEHHGGPPGARNDTWLYDVQKRTWRELACTHGPPPVLWPRMAYDPTSGRGLLVTRSGMWAKRKTVTLWSLDVGRGEWQKRHEQAWDWDIGGRRATGWSPSNFEIAFDPAARLLILTQNVRRNKRPVEDVFAMRLDLSALKGEPAPAWKPPLPIRPICTGPVGAKGVNTVPPADAKWQARLAKLPTNTWLRANPPQDTPDRGWGNAAADPVRGWAVYFGGGHSTYQVNNVDLYIPQANRWISGVGEHNDWCPPVSWGGVAMGLRGGRHAHHQRNEYVALDGRMYVGMGTASRRWARDEDKAPGARYAWFYDVDRGGVWRHRRIDKVTLGEGVPGPYARPCVSFPDGRIIGFGGALEPYDGRFFKNEAYAAVHDAHANTLVVKRVLKPYPLCPRECRPFCPLPDRNQVFYFEADLAPGGTVIRAATWVYDIRTNRFRDLKPTRHPPGLPGTVVYLPKQKAVLAIIMNRRKGPPQPWVYSFARNTWAPIALAAEGQNLRYATPYTQLVYLPTVDLVVNLPRTSVLRLDAAKAKWE